MKIKYLNLKAFYISMYVVKIFPTVSYVSTYLIAIHTIFYYITTYV